MSELPGAYLPLDSATAATPAWPAWTVPHSKVFAIGVDVGQVHDPSAIVVAQAQARCTKEADWLSNKGPEYETVFTVLGAERLALGTAYGDVGDRVCTLARRLRDREPEAYLVAIVDASGVGRPVVEMLRAHIVPEVMVCGVTLTGGNTWREGLFYRTECSVSKVQLVSRAQSLLQAGRIKMPRSAQTDALVEELRSFSLKTRPTGSIESGAFSVGEHDDLAVALFLATACDFSDVRIGPSIEAYGSPKL